MENIYSYTVINRLDKVEDRNEVIGVFFEKMSDEKWNALIKKINEEHDAGVSLKKYLKEATERYCYFSKNFIADDNNNLTVFKYLFYAEDDGLEEIISTFEILCREI